MTDVTAFNPHKEEDEGYLAAANGLSSLANPYPEATIRYRHWRSGWQVKNDETKLAESEGYKAATAGRRLEENPHPPGTIRYDDWQRGWHLRETETQRAARLGSTRAKA